MKTLIKNGTLINADKMWKADLLIDGEKIVRIEPFLEDHEANVIDAEGMLVMPGGV
ncbi:MAG: dihydropyrimidinase, partial [Chloroflexi bacterium]|nr:dihydropyrimidinase [Chloroflexota bacterium]